VLDLCPGGVVRGGKSRGEFAPLIQRAPVQGRRSSRQVEAQNTKGETDVKNELEFFIGIDLAAEKHQACLIDIRGKVLGELTFEHSGSGVHEFIRSIEKRCGGGPDRVGIALETPRGPIVEYVLERGYEVFSINPKQLDRFRDRHTVAGAKDDRRDAFVLADSLRTDLPLFRHLKQESATVIRLRELSRLEDDLIQDHNRLINQLREQLHRYFPQVIQLSSAAEDPWLWDLLEIAPLPAKACKLARGRIERVLKNHRIRRLSAEQVTAALRAPALEVAPGSAEAASEHVLMLLPRLRLVRKQRLDVASRMERLLCEMTEAQVDATKPQEQPTDVAILRSLPGVGRVVAGTLLAEASQAIADRDYEALRSYAGVAPVTRQSGSKRIVVMRRGCNNRLRNALYHWSRVAAICDERSRTHYANLRSHGHSHGRALRTLADRWLTVLISMLKKGKSFDSARWNTCGHSVGVV